MEQQVSKQNKAGGGAREMGRKRRVAWFWIAGLAFAYLVFLLCVNLNNWKRGNAIITSSCVLCLLIVWRGIFPQIDFLQKREDDATRGAEAEEKVAAVLDRLPRESHMVLHDVNTGRGDIDHIVIRRDGAVFVIETKSHRGNISEQNGRLMIWNKRPEKNFVAQAGRNAIWLSKRFQELLGATPWVNAAIVFPNASVSVRSKIGRSQVDVVSAKYVERWMAKAPANREIARRLAEQWETLETALRGGSPQ
jgi:hypothetical protein